MGFAVFTFFVVFLLFVSGGLLLFYREAMLQRINAAITHGEKRGTLTEAFQQTGMALGGVVEKFERLLPKSQAEVSIAQQRLIRAGYRRDSALKNFYGAKVIVPIILCALVTVTGAARANPFIIYLAAAGLWISGARFLAEQTDLQAPNGHPSRSTGCFGFAGHLHRSRPEPGPGDKAHFRRASPGTASHHR